MIFVNHLSSKLPFDKEPERQPESPARRILSVSELTTEIRNLLETRYFDSWVEGEISNCRHWQSGHLYFTLKDQNSQLKAVMFRTALRHLKFTPEDGQHVVARGRVSVYERKGEYQIVCEHLEPHGRGALQIAFEQLKKRLQDEGLFDQTRKRPLPRLPRKIGIVTSLDGAAIRDIIKVLRRRHPNLHLIIKPTRVQGDNASEAIARSLEAIAKIQGVDVIIVGRGGGSIEDLWAFNEESVARAIVKMPAPVISAVGHEIDFTIADFVADLRAATPSAAAELVIAAKEEVTSYIESLHNRTQTSIRIALQQATRQLHSLDRRPGLTSWPARLASYLRHIADMTHGLRHAGHEGLDNRRRWLHDLQHRLETSGFRRTLSTSHTRLVAADGQTNSAIKRILQTRDAQFRVLAGRLDNLSPLGVLARGYSICWNADRTAIIFDAENTNSGDTVRVTLRRGELSCEVK